MISDPALHQLTATLRQVRRTRRATHVADALTVALPMAAIAGIGAHTISGYGEMAAISVVALAATAAVVRPMTLLDTAARLDLAGNTGDLLTTAWMIGKNRDAALSDAWERVVLSQAADRTSAVAKGYSWSHFSTNGRAATVLTTLAATVFTLLLSPSRGDPASGLVADAIRHDAGTPLGITYPVPPAWATPQGVTARRDDEPETGGMTTAGQATTPVRQPGDDASGNGRSDADSPRLLPVKAGGHLPQAVNAGKAANGSGIAGDSANRPSSAQAGTVQAKPPSETGTAEPEIGAAANAGGPVDSQQSNQLAAPYRAIAQAYFARQ